MSVRVLIVDDQAPFRDVARTVVELTDGFEVVGEVETGEDSVTSARDLHPDLVLMDVNLPGMSGLEATKEILAGVEEARPVVVLVLSTYEADESVLARQRPEPRVSSQNRSSVPTGSARPGLRPSRLPERGQIAAAARAFTGMVPRTVVPAPGRERISTLPSSASNRSAMLVSPDPGLPPPAQIPCRRR